jgi:hypothetical protein
VSALTGMAKVRANLAPARPPIMTPIWPCCQKCLLPLERRNIGHDRNERAAGLPADFSGGAFRRSRTAAVDHDRTITLACCPAIWPNRARDFPATVC